MNTKRPYIYHRCRTYVCEPIILSLAYKLVQARTNNTAVALLVCSSVTSAYVRLQPQRAYVAARVLVSSYVLVRVRVLRVLCYLRPRLLSYLHGDLTQPPCPLASARDPLPNEICQQPRRVGYLNCAQAKQYKRQRTCGWPMTRAGFMVATCMSARQTRPAVRGLRGRTAKLKANSIQRRRYLSHWIYELQGIIAANHDLVAGLQVAESSNLVVTLLTDANLVSSKFALLPSTVFTLAVSPPVSGRIENVGLAHRFSEC